MRQSHVSLSISTQVIALTVQVIRSSRIYYFKLGSRGLENLVTYVIGSSKRPPGGTIPCYFLIEFYLDWMRRYGGNAATAGLLLRWGGYGGGIFS